MEYTDLRDTFTLPINLKVLLNEMIIVESEGFTNKKQNALARVKYKLENSGMPCWVDMRVNLEDVIDLICYLSKDRSVLDKINKKKLFPCWPC